ncbi:Major sperm protein [Caenorhabditis elegans]|uniref:Major sperm protein n=1 Tax=Caenorhabditis elegans TaxID=6239 RepID=Q93173_CAEEL|nr:Major sperm protein [Caenorhabditis elegans]CAB02715.2 Major sperm protein [Caenorhabditis elegans]|eukprot:NP_506723.2 Major sperm protein [Caenorhabditis elegans]
MEKEKSKTESLKKDEIDEANSESSKVPLTIDPEEAKLPNAGGKSEHMVVNFTSKRMAIKVRCGNALFRVEPTHMIIEPNKCRQLTINRMPGPIQKDKAIVQYLQIENDVQDPKAAFKAADSAGTKIPHLKIKLVAGASGGRQMSREVVDE